MNYFLLLLIFLTSCVSHNTIPKENTLLSIQLLDRNGFSETISTKERLGLHEQTNFLAPQPYQKVIRIFGRDKAGKSHSKITTYHSNGFIWQYLESVDGRAHGKYSEWYPTGQLKLEADVIEGLSELNELAQTTWVFQGASRVFDEQGHLIALIPYEKGQLHGDSIYYHQSGAISKKIPYQNGEIHGPLVEMGVEGQLLSEQLFERGVQTGLSRAFWENGASLFEETYVAGKLITGRYFNLVGELVSSIAEGNGCKTLFNHERPVLQLEYYKGSVEGQVRRFNDSFAVDLLYHLRNGKKQGEEIHYYGNGKPKLSIFWQEDKIQGVVSTWYETGVQESQKEMHANKKHGLCFGWYHDGSLMFNEEYDQNLLVKGSYYSKREQKMAVSKVQDGAGVATLFDADGFLLKRINYEKGVPVLY